MILYCTKWMNHPWVFTDVNTKHPNSGLTNNVSIFLQRLMPGLILQQPIKIRCTMMCAEVS